MKRLHFSVLSLLIVALLAACGDASPTTTSGNGAVTTITLGGYTTPREAYAKLIPLFQAKWKADTGGEVKFEESYQGSGAQSRAIVEGFEADVAALSLEADINRISDAGLITHDWKAGTHSGMVSTSVVVFAVREGNPKGIQDWADLAKPGVQILTPDPRTSGGAQWNILALYGAAKRGHVTGVPANDEAAAQAFLASVLKNVVVFDKGARESITNFEKGVGDVAITYENEVLVGQKGGQKYEMVIPSSTILIENPIALIDKSVEKHGNRQAVEAFITFLHSREAQEVFAEFGLRSVDADVAKANAERYPAITDQFTINEFGGWSKATPEYFGDNGVYAKVLAQVQQ